MRTLLSLRESEGKYASVLAKETDCTYTHMLKILKILESNEIIELKKSGRVKYITLTQIGHDIAHELEGLVRHLNRLKSESDKREVKKKRRRKTKKSRGKK